MSRITAPVGDVTTPIRRGRYGIGFLRAGANNPSAASRAFSFSNCAKSAPTPAGAMRSQISWYCERPGNVESRPSATTSKPSCGLNESCCTFERHITVEMHASASFRST